LRGDLGHENLTPEIRGIACGAKGRR